MIDINELRIDLEILKKYLEKVNRNLSYEKDIPDYPVRVSSGHGKYDYFYRNDNNISTYIPVSKQNFAKQLIQKEYDKKIKNKLVEQIKLLEHFIKKYDYNPLESCYENLCKGRQLFIEPIITPNDEYIKQWLEANPGNQNPFEEKGIYPTHRGEYVRSKSEKIIADMFYKMAIPYQYEPSFKMFNGKLCYPDFILLNVRERKAIYWEHLGLSSNKEYVESNLEKLLKYEKSGLVIGDNLLISIEAAGIPFDIKAIEDKIIKYII